MSHSEIIATLLQVKPSQVDAVIKLLDDGNTVPFIARYRKEMTGSLDDEQIRIIADE
ncbi:MAG TPA: Tex-like N-terminal domain-containing protein, partial [Anaerolineales bacterium]|nr:Tex-like N-terminal domain-containing protein [Anaerolineales bacterium]